LRSALGASGTLTDRTRPIKRVREKFLALVATFFGDLFEGKKIRRAGVAFVHSTD